MQMRQAILAAVCPSPVRALQAPALQAQASLPAPLAVRCRWTEAWIHSPPFVHIYKVHDRV
jgi:hypothetical protein